MTQVFEPLNFQTKIPPNNRGLPMMALHGTLAMWGSLGCSGDSCCCFWFLFPGMQCTVYLPTFGLEPKKTSVFEGQPPKTRPFPIKTRGPIWGSRLLCVRIFLVCLPLSFFLGVSLQVVCGGVVVLGCALGMVDSNLPHKVGRLSRLSRSLEMELWGGGEMNGVTGVLTLVIDP